MIDWKKYLIVFLITVLLFATASYVSNYFGQKKIDQLKSIQDKIAIDILFFQSTHGNMRWYIVVKRPDEDKIHRTKIKGI